MGAGAPPGADVWLGDSLGEMAAYYALADVALLGGSFEPLGGQNLIEAAACGCPVVMGPHTFNFSQAAEQALAAGAAWRVADLQEGVRAAQALAADTAARAAMARAGLCQPAPGRGAAHGGCLAGAVVAWPARRCNHGMTHPVTLGIKRRHVVCRLV
jgi:3-deoxy-D-manno-octulosonic-acid transferase